MRVRPAFLMLCIPILAACHKSAVGLRGMAGLGDIMTQGARETEEDRPRPRVIDAHTFFEVPNDELVPQPSWGMEVAFKAGNVLGAVVMPQHMRFYPKLDPKVATRLVLCGSPDGMKALASGLDKRSYGCIFAPVRQVSKEVAALAVKHRVPVVLANGAPSERRPDWESVIGRHPQVNFVIGEMGHPWEKDAARIVGKYPNAYADTAVVIDGAIPKNPNEVAVWIGDLLEPFKAVPDKLIFGSGWPRATILAHITAVMRTFPEPHWDTIFHRNANRLFNLELPADRFLTSSPDGGKKQKAPARN